MMGELCALRSPSVWPRAWQAMPISPPDLSLRERVAAAVHEAVCQFTGGDGFGYCYLYALGGWSLARAILGRDYRLQAGVLRVLASPPDGWLTMTAHPDGLSRGEFHCWFGLADARGEPAEIIDLATRHHKRWAGRIHEADPDITIAWTDPANPPDFVWSAPPFPAWMGLIPDLEMTRSFCQSIERQTAGLAPFLRLVERCHEGLG